MNHRYSKVRRRQFHTHSEFGCGLPADSLSRVSVHQLGGAGLFGFVRHTSGRPRLEPSKAKQLIRQDSVVCVAFLPCRRARKDSWRRRFYNFSWNFQDIAC